MTYSFTLSETRTFTVTHARHMAAKVATDLKRMQRFYDCPSDDRIAEFEAEITEFLKEGYLGTVTYGFKRDGQWIELTLRYTAQDLAGAAANDDDPGKVRPGANIENANFYSYMTYSTAWGELTARRRTRFETACLSRALARLSLVSTATSPMTARIHRAAGLSIAPALGATNDWQTHAR